MVLPDSRGPEELLVVRFISFHGRNPKRTARFISFEEFLNDSKMNQESVGRPSEFYPPSIVSSLFHLFSSTLLKTELHPVCCSSPCRGCSTTESSLLLFSHLASQSRDVLLRFTNRFDLSHSFMVEYSSDLLPLLVATSLFDTFYFAGFSP